MKKTDERTLRTKQKIDVAMVKLCQEKVDFDTLFKRIFYVLNFIF